MVDKKLKNRQSEKSDLCEYVFKAVNSVIWINHLIVSIYVAADTFSCNHWLSIKANIYMLSSVLKNLGIIALNVKNQIGHWLQ